MAVTVGDVMQACRNYFERSYLDGYFTIENGIINLNGLKAGPYIAIEGSAMNDGVFRVENGALLRDASDEQFTGRVWFLYPPRSFLALCEEIATFSVNNKPSAVVSESFGNYARTNATGYGGAVLTWKEVFSARLTPYRKMFTEVMV